MHSGVKARFYPEMRVLLDETQNHVQLLQLDASVFCLWDLERAVAQGIVAHQGVPQ